MTENSFWHLLPSSEPEYVSLVIINSQANMGSGHQSKMALIKAYTWVTRGQRSIPNIEHRGPTGAWLKIGNKKESTRLQSNKGGTSTKVARTAGIGGWILGGFHFRASRIVGTKPGQCRITWIEKLLEKKQTKTTREGIPV